MLALPHPIMAKVPVAAPCFRSSQSPHDDGTTQPDTSLPQICRSYQRPFWKLCKLDWNPLRRIEAGQSESRPFGPCQWLTPFPHGSKAGDFGQIDPETGQFVREGNIYRDEPLASIAKDYPPETTEPVYELKIDSGSTTRMSTLP